VSTGGRLAAYAVVLAAALGGGAAVGAAVGPDPGRDEPARGATGNGTASERTADDSGAPHLGGHPGDED